MERTNRLTIIPKTNPEVVFPVDVSSVVPVELVPVSLELD